MDFEKVVEEAFSSVIKDKTVSKETPIKDLGIDSLDLVEALMTIEDKLHIEFEDEEMLSFKVVGDVYNAIEKKLKK